MTYYLKNPIAYKKQSGSVLIVSLVILTAITIGAVVVMERSSGQLRMISNMQTQQQTFKTTHSPLLSIRRNIRDRSLVVNALNPLSIQYRAAVQAGASKDELEKITMDPTSGADGTQLLTPPSLNKGITVDSNTLHLVNLPGSSGQPEAGNSVHASNSSIIFINTTTASTSRLSSTQAMAYRRFHTSTSQDN